jgi:DNA-binding NtrC family response regulator
MAGKDLVLCVDDEPLLLRAVSIAIARTGFRTASAANGAAGLALFLQVKDEVCLVLADIIMPVINGFDMVERILQVEPLTKVLLMSGHSDEVIGRQVRRSGFPFIRKPFNCTTLTEKIRSIVGAAREAGALSRLLKSGS